MHRIGLLGLFVLLGWAELGQGGVSAQSPLVLADGAALVPADLLPPPCPQGVWDSRPGKAWGLDLILGLPTGVRVFHELGPPGGWAPQLEGIAGLYLIFPTAAIGLRWQWAPLHGERDALCLRPGTDVYVWDNPFHGSVWFFGDGERAWVAPAADLEIVWHHCFDQRWASDVGLKLGAGAVLTRRGAFFMPIGGIFLGLRY